MLAESEREMLLVSYSVLAKSKEDLKMLADLL
jgi:hypothetical protein